MDVGSHRSTGRTRVGSRTGARTTHAIEREPGRVCVLGDAVRAGMKVVEHLRVAGRVAASTVTCVIQTEGAWRGQETSSRTVAERLIEPTRCRVLDDGELATVAEVQRDRGNEVLDLRCE